MAQRDVFWLDGERSDSFGLCLQEPVTFGSAKPRYNIASVPGRNGTLHQFDGSFENVAGKARCFALEKNSVQNALYAVTKWCMLNPGYHRLETEEEPEIYRMAVVTSVPETEIRMKILAPFALDFDCKPQRFLKTGEQTVTLTQSGAPLYNPGMQALPLITVYGSGAGTLTAGGRTVTIKSIDEWLTLDCDLQDAYKISAPGLPAQNKNSTISAPEFPVLPLGESAVAWTGGIQRVEIVPRWWVL